jgi:hypothetical protein
MRYLWSIIFLLLMKNGVFSQTSIDRLMVEKVPNCEDISYNCIRLIQKYYETNRYDSSKIILNYWDIRCGKSEPILRLKILFAIKDGRFTEDVYDSSIIEYLKIYKDRLMVSQYMETYNNYKYYYGFVPFNSDFDKFTTTLAKTLMKDQRPNTLEYLFCKGYAENPATIFYELQKSDEYRNSKLSDYYYRQVNKYTILPDFGWSIFTGAWIPIGNISTVGSHPLVGFDFGFRNHQMIYNFSFYLKFLDSKNPYNIIYKGKTDTTSYFFGGYIGFDVEWQFFKVKRNEFHLLGGIGWDGFDAIETNSGYYGSSYEKGITMNSLNINSGIGFMHYFNYSKYIEIRIKYNLVSYSNPGGTNLSGNTITTSLVFGGFNSYYKRSKLKTLNYLY